MNPKNTSGLHYLTDGPLNNNLNLGFAMSAKPYFIRAEWDEEARVWVATGDDVPGLATEEKNLEGLIEKLKVIIPELLEANGMRTEYEIPFEVLMRRFEVARFAEI